MFKDELRSFVESNPRLVTKKHVGENLYILKYARRVFYDNLWNDYLEECRGTVIDGDYNVVSYPFTKIYNFRVEDKSPLIDDIELVTAYRKVNGFMVAITYHNKDLLISTTGSISSDFVVMAKEMMLKHMSYSDWLIEIASNPDYTFLFECVHPNDPHIIPEECGIYYLGFREKCWNNHVNMYGLDVLSNMFHCFIPESFITTVGDLVNRSKSDKHEGYVFYTSDGRSAKIKTPYYLVNKSLARKSDILTLNKQKVDEEYYPLLDHLKTKREWFNGLDEQSRLVYIRDFLKG